QLALNAPTRIRRARRLGFVAAACVATLAVGAGAFQKYEPPASHRSAAFRAEFDEGLEANYAGHNNEAADETIPSSAESQPHNKLAPAEYAAAVAIAASEAGEHSELNDLSNPAPPSASALDLNNVENAQAAVAGSNSANRGGLGENDAPPSNGSPGLERAS